MSKHIIFTIQEGNAITYEADVLALKYAGTFYGVDHSVAALLVRSGIAGDLNDLRARTGLKLVDTNGAIASKKALFIATPRPREFTYDAVREFSATMLYQLKFAVQPPPRIAATTLHGIGFGLDEIETISAQFAGIVEAIRAGDYPDSLEQITVIELESRRVQRCRAAIDRFLKDEPAITPLTGEGWGYAIDVNKLRGIPEEEMQTADRKRATAPAPAPAPAITQIEQEAAKADTEKHVFVAMPFNSQFEDLWEFGIYMPIRELDLQGVRIDREVFSGDIFDQIRYRIETAAAIVAVIDSLNANVMLELGYAMGKGVPAIILVSKAVIDEKKLPFDLQSQRCLGYANIKDCKRLLQAELDEYRRQGIL